MFYSASCLPAVCRSICDLQLGWPEQGLSPRTMLVRYMHVINCQPKYNCLPVTCCADQLLWSRLSASLAAAC